MTTQSEAGTDRDRPLCDMCDEHWATHVIDGDLGDVDGAAAVAYRVACDACKHRSSYMDPEPLTPAWERYFRAPWNFYDAPHAKKGT